MTQTLTEISTARPHMISGPETPAARCETEYCQPIAAEETALPLDLGELVLRVNHQTLQQVSELSIHHRNGGLVATGRTRTYYAKQLVTQAIRNSLPTVRLMNEIHVE